MKQVSSQSQVLHTHLAPTSFLTLILTLIALAIHYFCNHPIQQVATMASLSEARPEPFCTDSPWRFAVFLTLFPTLFAACVGLMLVSG